MKMIRTAAVIPFPSIKRKAFAFRHACLAAQLRPPKAEEHIERQITLQSQTMAKRGIADDLIEKDLSALRVRMFAEYWRLVTTHRHGGGDAA
jgi:Family of unknown function (DUF6074)